MARHHTPWIVGSLAAVLSLGLSAALTGCATPPFSETEALEMESRAIRFVARETEGDASVWHPADLLLERAHGLEDLVFILENPTSVQHTFVMPEAKRITRERIVTPESSGDLVVPIRLHSLEPLAVRLAPGETKHIRVSTASLPRGIGTALRYFCTIHKDVAQAGSLYLL